MKKKIILIILGLIIVLGVIMFMTRDKSPVSHFVSDEGKQKFTTAYNKGMSQVPKPDKTLDIKTSFGTRVLL